MISYQEALATAQSMYVDSTLKDSGLALQETLRDLTRLSQSTTAHPLVVIDAYEVCEAIAQGPDSEEGTQNEEQR